MGSSLQNKMGRAMGAKVDMPERDPEREVRRTAKAMENEGGRLMTAFRDLRPEQTQMLERLDADAIAAMDRGGRMSAQELRDVQQSARGAMNVRGRAGDNMGVFTEAFNRYDFQRQRQEAARQQALTAMGARQQFEPVPEHMMGQAGQAFSQTANLQGMGELEQSRARGELAGSGMGAAAALIGGAVMMSDERLKKDVEATGKELGGVKEYKYRYKWEDGKAPKRTGVMAQDVLEVNPGAVVPFTALAVDYSKLA